jgi:hypothetical protein
MPKRKSAYQKGGLRKKVAQASVNQAVKAALKNTRIGGYIGLEKKFHDDAFTGLIPVTTTVAQCDPPGPGPQTVPGAIGLVPQGNGPSSREGRKMTIDEVDIRGNLEWEEDLSGQGPAPSQPVRFVLFVDKQTNEAQTPPDNVLEPLVGVNDKTLMHYNLENTKRFHILKDFMIQPPIRATAYNGNTVGTGPYEKNFRIKHKFKQGLIVNYDIVTTLGVIGAVEDNSIHLVCIMNGTISKVRMNYVARTRFYG